MKSTFLRTAALCTLFCCAVSAHAQPVEIKIGATLPLTGPLAVIGADTRRGIELGVKDFSSDKVSFAVIFDDNQHAPKLAAISARKLIDVDKSGVLISMWDMADIVAPFADQKKIPHIAIRWDPGVTERFNYTFTVESTYLSYMESLVALLKHLDVHSIGILSEDSKGWGLGVDYLKQQAAAAGIAVLADERYIGSDTDHKTMVLRAASKAPDMLVVLSNPPHTQLLIKEIKAAFPRQPFTGYLENIGPELVPGVPFPAQFQVSDWFAEKFTRAYGEAPKVRAAQAYDIVHLLAVAAGQSGRTPTPEALIQAAHEKIFESGAAGPLITKSPRVIENKCVWEISRDGQFKLYP